MERDWQGLVQLLNDFVFPLLTLVYIELRSLRKDLHAQDLRLVAVEAREGTRPKSITPQGG